ncbi:MAG TPA: SDR family oxidoreductase [Terriglobia bacterium]|jgi:NAD(P)-dependent dehydrogenase (short-subunit alcohol dehydrogenase family)|nr:SDR family oxidoreductase [Terriglobia bacterium]
MTGPDYNQRLAGRRGVVTGAAKGLGLAIARRLLADGANVLLVDKDPMVLSHIGTREFPVSRAFALVKDLAEADAARFVFSKAPEALGTADILINNAAWSFHKPMLEVTFEEFDTVVGVNQRAPYFLAQEFLRQLSRAANKPPDSAIVNIASVNALAGNPNLVAYAGTKGALVAMTRAIAVEMKELGVRVNTISPAAIETFHTKQLIASGVIDPPKLLEPYLIKRFASCEEIAELVAFLCSSAASYVNGANWVIDGGYMAQ